MLTIPSFLLDVLTPDQKAMLNGHRSEQVEHSAKLLREGAELLATCHTDELVETAKLLRTAIDQFLKTTDPQPTAATPTTSGKTYEQRSYDRCWYYTMAHRPADLRDRTYKDIKTDPRIVAIWAEAKALDAAGRLTSSGKVK